MIYICEPECKGFAHEEINSAIIAMYLKHSNCKLFTEESHFQHILKIWKSRKVEISNMIWEKKQPLKRKIELFDLLHSLFLTLNIFINAKVNSINRVVFLSISSPHLYAIKLLCLFFRNINIDIVLHGILESLLNKPSKKPWKFLFWFGFPFTIGKETMVTYISLSPSIGEFLKNTRFKKDNILSLHHPVIWNENIGRENKEKFIISTIGKNTKYKGGNNINTLLYRLEELKLDYQYYSLGPSIISVKSSKIHLSRGRMKREEMEQLLKITKYIILPYHPRSYRLMASGAFFDAMNYGIPIIAIENNLIKYYVGLLGNIGYIVSNIDELSYVVKDLIKKDDSKEYQQMVENIKESKTLLSNINQKVLSRLLK